MERVFQISLREFKAYFVSPIAYIVISIFLLVTGWFFFTTFFLYDQATLRNFFGLLPIVFSFVIPAVTMRLFSEEFNVGSYETLLTLPVSFNDVILGKFLASVAFVFVMLVPTFSYALFVSFLGNLDWGPVAGGYAGAVLLGASFCSIGLFASSLTRNQIISFIIAMIFCFGLTLIDKMLFFFPQTLLDLVNYLGAGFHFQNISKGIIDSRDLIYFVSVIFVGLYCTNLALKRRK